jgi:DNA repair exonuclease SbcCD ATPase subunit
MKIQTIEIKNDKAFYGTHTIKITGKNVFIYGKNGSG